MVLIDPLPLAEAALKRLGTVEAICLTAKCHQRSAWRYRKKLGVKVYAPHGVRPMDEEPDVLYRAGDQLPGVFVFAAGKSAAYSRMFAPHTSRIPEDPATGSASGPLGAYLVQHGLVPASGAIRLVSEQGTKMGRQSFVHICLQLIPKRLGKGGQRHGQQAAAQSRINGC